MTNQEYHEYVVAECKRQWHENQEEVYGAWELQDENTKKEYYNEIYELYKDNVSSSFDGIDE